MIEKVVSVRGHFYVNEENTLPVRVHELRDEIMNFQKELAGAIYFQRCLEKNL